VSWHQKCSNYALTNLLFGFVQVCVSDWLLVIIPSPIPELQHAPLPPKCCKLGMCPQLFILLLFSLLTHIWAYQGVWECVKPCLNASLVPLLSSFLRFLIQIINFCKASGYASLSETFFMQKNSFVSFVVYWHVLLHIAKTPT
jgi:hypothetical protein